MFDKLREFIGSGVNGMEAADRWLRYGDGEIGPEAVKQMAQERGERDADAFYRGFSRRYNGAVDAYNHDESVKLVFHA